MVERKALLLNEAVNKDNLIKLMEVCQPVAEPGPYKLNLYEPKLCALVGTCPPQELASIMSKQVVTNGIVVFLGTLRMEAELQQLVEVCSAGLRIIKFSPDPDDVLPPSIDSLIVAFREVLTTLHLLCRWRLQANSKIGSIDRTASMYKFARQSNNCGVVQEMGYAVLEHCILGQRMSVVAESLDIWKEHMPAIIHTMKTLESDTEDTYEESLEKLEKSIGCYETHASFFPDGALLTSVIDNHLQSNNPVLLHLQRPYKIWLPAHLAASFFLIRFAHAQIKQFLLPEARPLHFMTMRNSLPGAICS